MSPLSPSAHHTDTPLKRVIPEEMGPSPYFFIIHLDSLLKEEAIVEKQKLKVFPHTVI